MTGLDNPWQSTRGGHFDVSEYTRLINISLNAVLRRTVDNPDMVLNRLYQWSDVSQRSTNAPVSQVKLENERRWEKEPKGKGSLIVEA